jgi:hypothetical protein
MKEAPGSSETSVLTRATRRNNPEDTILHIHRRENLKSYISENVVSADFPHNGQIPPNRTVIPSCQHVSFTMKISD